MKRKCIDKKSGYQHLTFQERELLAYYLAEKKQSQREIAHLLQRSPSTISREINRNGSFARKQYLASQADKRSQDRKKKSHIKDRLKTPEIRKYVISKLKEDWTPEAIAGRIGIDIKGAKTNHESIYLYIYKDNRSLIEYLPQAHRKRIKRSGNKGKRASRIPNRVSIDERPAIINERQRVGDWEVDTMVSRQSTSALLVMRERKSHFTLIQKIQSKSAREVRDALTRRLKVLPCDMRLSITYDNGTENTLHEDVSKKLKLDSYFCNPYHSWEKGSVENTNGLIRRYLPKKTNFSLISDLEIALIEEALNNRPRKSLNFLTPYEYLERCA